MLELNLKEYCEKVGIKISETDISIIETYIELKLKDQESKLIKPYLVNFNNEKLYPNQLNPYRVTCDENDVQLF